MAKKETPKIIKILRIVMPIVGLTTMIIFVPWDLVTSWLRPLPDSVQENMNDMLKYDIEGVILYVDEAGEEPDYYTAGWDDRKHTTPMNPKSLSKIGSIEKLYVAVSITKLVHRDSISLDDKMIDYFPELSERIEYSDEITLRMMIQHRSGIPNFTDNPDYPWDSPPQSSGEALEFALDLPAEFRPGKKYSYSNTNYLLLGEILEQQTGLSGFEFFKEIILDPLGLKNTYPSIHEVDPDSLMNGYFLGYEPSIKQDAHGGMIASAEDVAAFIRALNDGTLLTDEENEIYASVYDYGHSGWIPGYLSHANYYAEKDMVVIQFSNTSFDEEFFALTEILYNRNVKILLKKD